MAQCQPTDTRGRILAAATRLFAELGFNGASVRQICEAAGVSKPVVYYHFASRDGLLMAVLQNLGEGFNHLSSSHLTGRPPSREALVGLMTALLDLSSSDRWIMRLMYRITELPPHILAHLPPPEEHERPLAVFLEEGIRAGVFPETTDVRAVIWLLSGAFAHLATMELHHERPGTSRALAERLVAQVLPVTPQTKRPSTPHTKTGRPLADVGLEEGGTP